MASVSLIASDPPPEVLLFIPEMAALVHTNPVPVTLLVGAYPNVEPVQISAGVNDDVNLGCGNTFTTKEYVFGFVHPLALTV